MKRILNQISVWLVLVVMALACAEDETYIDPMIAGLCEQTQEELAVLEGKSWEVVLVHLHANRQKMLNVRDRIEHGDYSRDEYDLQSPDQSKALVLDVIQDIDVQVDSLWAYHLKDSFELIDDNSAGITTFGARSYQATAQELNRAYAWLKAEYKADSSTWEGFQLIDLKGNVSKLSYLNSFTAEAVEAYVTGITTKLSVMKTSYQSLSTDIDASPDYTVAQKALYAKISDDLAAIETKIAEGISLETSDELDLIDRDLYALVYFKDNNHTSPALRPLVWGEISNISELRWLSEEATVDDCTGDWVLTADIDAAETHRWNQDEEEKGFQQIKEFSGSFDGRYHMISGLLMTKYSGPPNNREGFFQNFVGTLKHLALVNLYLQSPVGVGGQGGVLVGHLQNGTVEQCFTHGARQLNSQSGGFVGRTLGAVNLIDCFAAVDCDYTGAQGTAATNTSSFLGLPVGGPVVMKNCYTIGVSQLRALLGFGAGVNLAEATGIYYDSSVVGVTEVGHAAAYGETVVRLEDDGVVTDLATAQWGDLANFPEYNREVWEVMTVSAIDAHARPYLKGFDYAAFAHFLDPK